RTIKQGKLEVLVGASIQQNNSSRQRETGSGYNSDAVMKNLSSAATFTTSSGSSVYKYNALFGNLNYNWKDKYIINLNARRDGSSRFGALSQFHNFGSIAGAWIFSNESFIKNHASFLSFGKLKGSYGSTGNDQIGDYQFLNLYNNFTSG